MIRAASLRPSFFSSFAASGTTLAIHLSIHNLAQVARDLLPAYGAECPVAIVWRASWPDERIIRATLGTMEAACAGTGAPERTALILVGPALDAVNIDSVGGPPPAVPLPAAAWGGMALLGVLGANQAIRRRALSK